MKGTSWIVAICFGVLFLYACLLFMAVIVTGVPSVEIVGRILSALGLLVTSVALILTSYFIVLAVSAYGHIAHIRETCEKTDSIAEEAKENLKEAKRSETVSHDIMNKITEYALGTISAWSMGMQQIIYLAIEIVTESPTSKTFPKYRKEELLDYFERIQIELDRSRARIVLEVSTLPEEVLKQLKMVFKVGEETEIHLVSDIKEKWAENDDIRELCDKVLKRLRDKLV